MINAASAAAEGSWTLGWLGRPRKWPDLVVLNDDYFSVPEEGIKDIRSVLTVVDGDVVHDDGVL